MWMIILLVLATPVQLTADLHWAEAADLSLCWRIWGIPLRQRMRLFPTGRGHRLTTQTEDQPPHAPAPEKLRRGMALIGTVLRTDKARRWLQRAIRLRRLDALISVGTGSAAVTAVVSGLASGITRLASRQARIRIRPDFLTGRTEINARCIIFFHLGSLLPSAAMTLWAAFLEAREHRVPPLSKEV